MREVPERPPRQYFRIAGHDRYHIAYQFEVGGDYYTLCGFKYDAKCKATPIVEYVGDECHNCRYATSKERRVSAWSRERVLEVKIRRGRILPSLPRGPN